MTFNTRIYSVEAVLGTSHKFLADSYVSLDFEDEDGKTIAVTLETKDGSDVAALAESFREELILYAIKLKVLKGTSQVRDQVFHIVFNTERVSASEEALRSRLESEEDGEVFKLSDKMEKLLDEIDEEEEFDFEDDPLGITTPWEDIHGQPEDVVEPREQLQDQVARNMVVPSHLED